MWPPSSGIITLMMETANTSEKSGNFCQTTWHNNPEDSHLQVSLLFNSRFFINCSEFQQKLLQQIP
jgi:hypothetical protein